MVTIEWQWYNIYGISGDACEFFPSFLTGRLERVKISNERSPRMALLKRIPQGSNLGPFTFNLFINDIFYFIERYDLSNHADDDTFHHI